MLTIHFIKVLNRFACPIDRHNNVLFSLVYSDYVVYYLQSPIYTEILTSQVLKIIFDLQTFHGNTNRNEHAVNWFDHPVHARYFRLTVKAYYNWPTLRMDYLVC